MFKQVWVASILAVLVGYAASVESRLIVEKRWVPVNVTDSSGNDVSQDIMVTIFHDDDAPMPYPALVLNHGRAPHADKRAALGRAQYSAASRWLAQLGFMVAVPTRIGYGVSGGKDVEFTGDCGHKDYAPGYAVIPFPVRFCFFRDQKLLHSSYPRKRVSSGSVADWIPAFTGMTKIYSELV